MSVPWGVSPEGNKFKQVSSDDQMSVMGEGVGLVEGVPYLSHDARDVPTPPCRKTDACKNITYFVSGWSKLLIRIRADWNFFFQIFYSTNMHISVAQTGLIPQTYCIPKIQLIY